MKKIIPWFGATDIGRRRKSNQDCFAAFEDLGLWILCDGMGGHTGGAEAAARAVAVIEAEVRGGRNLLEAVELAHLAVVQLGDDLLRNDETLRRPGTTVVALRTDLDKYELVWVGDSRAWLWNGKRFSCLTTDHTVVQEMVNWGDLTEDEALRHPQRHQLSQALGVDGRGKLQPGQLSGRRQSRTEVIVLTSDGAFCHVNPFSTAGLLANTREPEEIVNKMIAESLRQGGEDNVTVVAVGNSVEDCVKPGILSKPFYFFKQLGERLTCLNRSFSLPALSLILVVSVISVLFSASIALATMPSGDELDCVCHETAARLAAGLEVASLERVAVYCLCPRGCSPHELDSQMKSEAKVIALALQDALTTREEFKVLNRDNPAWARALHEEGNRGTLNGNDIMRVGAGLGARWIVTGEYWESEDGLFHLKTRIFNGESGELTVADNVDSSFVSSQRRRLWPVLLGLAAILLLLVGGGALLVLTRKRKYLWFQNSVGLYKKFIFGQQIIHLLG